MAADKAILEQDDALYDEAAEVVRLASAAGLTVGCAESCTGGLVSACLTSAPGSSAAVRGGVVSYAIPVKHDVLGVPYDGLLDVPQLGAVSSECAAAMAMGARKVLSCDACVSVTGIAGPGGGEPGKPVGTVWFGIDTAPSSRTVMHLLEGDRADVRRQACHVALGLLREALMELSAK
ncbi:CinA family protein [Paratractidigestivibacter sp.]|uniref:CinA family protein n=1 Tax=Paratractidigestivibacter sp. TaxID=2847316 RepID=UPI002AC8D6B7|nr:CinA family protein [Paratractidigestivibacter sp.]